MISRNPVMRATLLLRDGQRAFDAGEYYNALTLFQESITVAATVPPGEQWPVSEFIAACRARISSALLHTGQLEECVQTCNEVLKFIADHPQFANMYRLLEPTRWFSAKLNKGVALTRLGRPQEATLILRELRTELSNAGADTQVLTICDREIQHAERALGETADS